MSDPTKPGEWLLELPGWHHACLVTMRTSDLPSMIVSRLETDYRCHAVANLDAESVSDLVFTDWEAD